MISVKQVARAVSNPKAATALSRARQLARGAAAISCVLACLFAAGAAAENAESIATAQQTAELVNNLAKNQSDAPRVPVTAGNTTSAQDLSLFGILALGIIGLLWIRRHTAEL